MRPRGAVERARDAAVAPADAAAAALKGFAVVADEVRKLAVESAEAAGSTSEIISDVGRMTERVAKLAGEGASRTEVSVTTVARSREFEGIAASARAVAERVSVITGASSEAAQYAQDTRSRMTELSSLAESSSGRRKWPLRRSGRRRRRTRLWAGEEGSPPCVNARAFTSDRSRGTNRDRSDRRRCNEPFAMRRFRYTSRRGLEETIRPAPGRAGANRPDPLKITPPDGVIAVPAV